MVIARLTSVCQKTSCVLWWRVVHKFNAPSLFFVIHIGCRQHETAYQLVLNLANSRVSTSDDLIGPPPPLLPVPPLAAPANTGQSSSTADEGCSAG